MRSRHLKYSDMTVEDRDLRNTVTALQDAEDRILEEDIAQRIVY